MEKKILHLARALPTAPVPRITTFATPFPDIFLFALTRPTTTRACGSPDPGEVYAFVITGITCILINNIVIGLLHLKTVVLSSKATTPTEILFFKNR